MDALSHAERNYIFSGRSPTILFISGCDYSNDSGWYDENAEFIARFGITNFKTVVHGCARVLERCSDLERPYIVTRRDESRMLMEKAIQEYCCDKWVAVIQADLKLEDDSTVVLCQADRNNTIQDRTFIQGLRRYSPKQILVEICILCVPLVLIILIVLEFCKVFTSQYICQHTNSTLWC